MTSLDYYDTIVVGAGAAGLYAAYLLQERHEKNVLVLEAKDRIGGRLFAAKVKGATGSKRRDLGGQWTGKTQYHVLRLLSELKIETGIQYSKGKKRVVFDDSENAQSYSELLLPLGILELLELNSMIKKIERMARTVDANDVTKSPNAVHWDSMTLYSFVMDHCKFKASREAFESSIRAVFGVDLSRLSLLYFLYFCKQAGGFEPIILADNGGAQEIIVPGTMFQLCERLSDKLRSVRLGEPVCSVVQDRDIWINVKTESGNTFRSKDVVIAIPPHLINGITFSPRLPNSRLMVGDFIPGHYIKFIVTYHTPFWRKIGFSGETLALTLPCAKGPLTVTFDGTSEDPAIIGFIAAEHAIYWEDKTMKERGDAVLQALATAFGEEALSPIDYVDKDWSKEPYNGGCPFGIPRPRGLLYCHQALIKPFGRIHWAGTESATVWSGYVEGALESATRAVSEIISNKFKGSFEAETSPVFSDPEKFSSRDSASFSERFADLLRRLRDIFRK